MSVTDRIADIERQIAALKAERDKLLKNSGLEKAELERVLRFRTPKRTICQLLRELHDDLKGAQREKVGKCLLMAKKMDGKLVEYVGRHYHKDWYDERGEFKG